MLSETERLKARIAGLQARIEELEAALEKIRPADAALGAMVRRMPPGWMLGHEGRVQRRVTSMGQLLPWIAPGLWRVSYVTHDHHEEVCCVEREPDQALKAALGLREWADSTDDDANRRLAAALGEGQ